MPGKGNRERVADRVAREAKEDEALRLRIARNTFSIIAETLEYETESGAYRAYQRALKRHPAPDATEQRVLENQRLDRLMLTYWQRAMNGEREAGEFILKAMKRRAEMNGLDAPAEVQLGATESFLDALREFGASRGRT